MTAIVRTALPEEIFQDFFRSFQSDQMGSKYRKRLAQVAVSNGKSLIIDFDDLISFDPALARSIVEKPDDFIGYASSAATAQMRVEDPEYAEHVGRIFARFRRFPEKTALRRIGAEHIKKLGLVDGIVVRSTQVRPTIVSAVFRCRKCLETIVQDQEGELIRGPGTHCPFCKQSTSFELIEEQSKFKNTQEARIQERPEDLPPGQLPRYLDIRLEDDLVDSARPGDRVAVTSIVRAEKQTVGERGKLRTFNIYLEANFVDVVGKETEVVEITPEDEKRILEASQDPWVHRKLIMSLAPSIYGYEDVKEGILYALFGGTAKQLPDGVNIRGDENVLLIGDPGCLVGDERIVLGDGTIAKIQDLGRDHLEEIDVPVLTGQGGGKRDLATRFHIYRNQPTIEIVTESGKSIRGTYNHPLLSVERENRTLLRRWKRLDEFRIGDRVAVVSGFPCYSRRIVETKFKLLPYTRGPRFRGRLPKKVTPELGAFLGYVLGDGWVQRYRVGFLVADGEKDLLAPLCELARKLFGISPSVTARRVASRKVVMHQAVVGSQVVASNLSFLKEKRVPNLILASGNEVVVQFLKWLYEADGTVLSSKRGCGAIGLNAKDIELLRDVQILLLRFGIHSRIIGDALITRRGESLLKFAKKIGFVSNKKQACLVNLEERASRLKRLRGQRSERIVEVYNREPTNVYDIEVPRSHRFIANGIVSHNTAKSQLLQYVSRIAPRGLYTSGRGTTAAGLCVDGDSILFTSQGLRTIRDVVEDSLRGNSTMSETGETIAREPTPIELIAPVVEDHVLNSGASGSLLVKNVSLTSLGLGRVTQYYRLRSLFTIKVRTMLGKEILLTPETKIGCYDPSLKSTYWTEARCVRQGDQVLLTSRLPDLFDGRSFHLPILQYVDEKDFIRLEAHVLPRLLHSLKCKYGTLRKAARAIGVHEDLVYYRWLRKGIRLRYLNKICEVLGLNRDDNVAPYVRAIGYKSFRRFQTVLVPRDMKQIMQFAGSLYADGCLSMDKRGGRGICVRFASGDYEECESYRRLTKTLFGLYPKIEKDKRAECYEVRFTNKIVGRLIHSFGLPIGFKPSSLQIDPIITSAPRDLVAAFLSGLISHDGWVSREKSIGFSCSSKRMALQVDLCLQRFGIITALRKRQPKTTIVRGRTVNSTGNYEISIYDAESLKIFDKNIGFSQPRNREKLALVIRSKTFDHSNFTRIGRDMIAVRVKQVSKQLSAGFVYDLTVEGSHSFLANGFIVHNTAAVLREKTGGMILEAGALVLADKGVACLHPDSQVFIDGLPTRISDLFDVKTAEIAKTKAGDLVKISSLGRRTVNLDLDNLGTREAAATFVTERDYKGGLLRVHMKSGFELRVTPDHLLLDGPSVRWMPAGEFRVGDRLLTMQRLPGHHDKIRTLEILPDDWIVQPSIEERAELRKRVLSHFPSIASATRHYGLRRETLSPKGRDAIPLHTFRRMLLDLDIGCWHDRVFAYGRRKRTERFPVAHITSDLAYILGFIYGDGYARSNSRHSIVRIKQSELHRQQIDRLQEASKTTLKTPWHDSQKPGSSQHSLPIHNLRHDSNLLFAIYDWATRNGLLNLLRLGQDELAGFLAGCMDADGCISTKRYWKDGKKYQTIDITFSLSDDLDANRMLLLALRRFDVFARIRQQKGVKNVQTMGREDATRLIRALGPYSIKCRDIPLRSTAISSDNEEVPGPLLARILRKVQPPSNELLRTGAWSTFYQLRAGTRRPFKSGVRRLRDNLERWLSPGQAASLDVLSASDYAMDEIVSIDMEYYRGPVYDLRVPEGSSFLADGVCVHNCIDELDKMRPDDRVAIHEALEQQTVSVAKGGIVATLNARAAVLAAANPALGRYEPHRNVGENINLPVTILSRFDLIFIIKDQPEADYDARMAEHILALHRSRTSPETAPFPPEFLRKYIAFAKRIIPVLSPEAVIELRDFYLKMRSKGGTEAAVAITPRQLEALVRISEARARAFLRDRVTVEDAKSAIRIMTVSLSDVGVDVKTGAMDIDVIMTGKPRSLRDSFQKVIETVAELERETGTVEETVLVAALVDKEKMQDGEARRLIGQLIKEGILYSPKPGRLKRTAG